jgi:hypothetical protein
LASRFKCLRQLLKFLCNAGRKRKLYSAHKGQKIQIDEKVFEALVMAIVNDEAKVIDI